MLSLLQKIGRVAKLCLQLPQMDDIISLFNQNGIYFIVVIGAIKLILILLYKGLDPGYMIENFFFLYKDVYLESDPRRRKYRQFHNFLTVMFYLTLALWMIVAAIIRVVK